MSTKQASFRKYVLVPASVQDESQAKAARHAEEIKSLRHYNPTLESLATLREQFESVFTRTDIGDADKLALIHSIQNRFDSLKQNVMGAPVVPAPPPAAPAAAAPAPPAAAPPAAAPAPPPAAPPAATVVPPPPPVATATAMTADAKALTSLSGNDPAGTKGLPQMYDRKVTRFDREILKQHPNRIGVDHDSGELMIDGKRIANSNFADLKRELYIHNKLHNLTGLDAFTSTISSLMPSSSYHISSLISNSKIIEKIQPEEVVDDEGDAAHSTKSYSYQPYSKALEASHATKAHSLQHHLKHNLKYQDAQESPALPPLPANLPPPPGNAPKILRLYD